ncbi:MAG: glycosyltransferase [Bacteroidia bacterium]|nr:glycosyltransferase [Bacteroidia bacterium]
MKLLILTSRFPYPLEKGDKLRIYHQIRVLSQSHEIVLCSLSDQPVSSADRDALKPFCSRIFIFPLTRFGIFWNLFLTIFSRHPFQVGYFFRPSVKHELDKILETEKPDRVFCQLIRMYEYTAGWQIPLLLDYMDCFSVGMARRAKHAGWGLKSFLNWEAKKLARAEILAARRFDLRTIISEQDRLLLPEGVQKEVYIIPNGIDTRFFSRQTENISAEYLIVFVGNLGYFPNVNAARFLVRKIMPEVWKVLPNAKVLLAGARPAPGVMALTQNPRVVVSGWVEDIRTAYIQGEIFVAPLFTGSGQQNKILEAMAMGVPCITTPLVNNAIGAAEETEILLADTPESFATQIIRLHRDKNLHQTLRNKGVYFVNNHFSWEKSVQMLEVLLKK